MKLLTKSAAGNCCKMLEGAEGTFHLMSFGGKML